MINSFVAMTTFVDSFARASHDTHAMTTLVGLSSGLARREVVAAAAAAEAVAGNELAQPYHTGRCTRERLLVTTVGHRIGHCACD